MIWRASLRISSNADSRSITQGVSSRSKKGTAGSRGTVNVNVSAPNDQIQGLYQIVNQAAGSLSNHVMVRPGTN